MLILSILFILLMAVLSNQAGGSLGAERLERVVIMGKPYKLTFLPEAIIALIVSAVSVCGAVALFGFSWPWLCLIFIANALSSYGWFQTGHGKVLPWGMSSFFKSDDVYEQLELDKIKSELKTRTHTLTPVVHWIARKLRISTDNENSLYSVNYCRLFMAVKGFLIGLPVGGIPMMILLPLSYEIGKRNYSPKMCELLAGASLGVTSIIYLSVLL